MRLSRRILDLVQALTRAAPRTLAAGRRDVGESREWIEAALARAEARRRQLEENLAAAEQAGQEEAARLARRQIEELTRSAESLRQTLDHLAARQEAAARPSSAADPAATATPEVRSDPDADPDLVARKRRLAGPG